jgi:AAA domain
VSSTAIAREILRQRMEESSAPDRPPPHDDADSPEWRDGPGEGVIDDGVKPFPVVHVLSGEAPDPPALLVSDLLVDRDINLWTGHGAAGKTVLALMTATCVAIGRSVFGSLPVLRSGPVLLVLPEDGQTVARMMLDAIIAGLGLDDYELELAAKRLIMVTDETVVNLVRDTRRLKKTAIENNAVFVALDPLRNVIGGEPENDNDLAGDCIAALRRDVCRGAGAALLLTHHHRKPGKDFVADTAASPHETRGAGAWANSSRLVFSIAKKDSRLTMTATKSNRLRSDIRHELTLTIDADPENKADWRTCIVTDSNAGGSSETLTAGKGRALNQNELAALACLSDEHEPEKRVSWSAWRDDSGLNPNTFRSVKTRLLDAGLVAALPTGRKNRNGGADYSYQITDAGRLALKSGWAFERLSGEGVRSGE